MRLLDGTDVHSLIMIILQINEAFASQFAYCVEQLDIPIEKINVKYVHSF